MKTLADRLGKIAYAVAFLFCVCCLYMLTANVYAERHSGLNCDFSYVMVSKTTQADFFLKVQFYFCLAIVPLLIFQFVASAKSKVFNRIVFGMLIPCIATAFFYKTTNKISFNPDGTVTYQNGFTTKT